jgi:hypothetical protein
LMSNWSTVLFCALSSTIGISDEFLQRLFLVLWLSSQCCFLHSKIVCLGPSFKKQSRKSFDSSPSSAHGLCWRLLYLLLNKRSF